MVNLINGDCLDEMDKLIKDGVKVDLIITSPPYNMGHNKRNSGGILIKYNTYSDDMTYEDYEEWIINILNKCYKLLSDKGVIYFNHKERHIKGKYFNPINLIQRSKMLPLQTIIWKRGGCTFNIGRFVNCYEQIIVAHKSSNYLKINKECEKLFDVWDIPPEKCLEHPAPFPLKLVDRITGAYSNSGTLTVFDPFMGRGTTGISAINQSFNYIGIELDRKYFNLSKKNINIAKNGFIPNLF